MRVAAPPAGPAPEASAAPRARAAGRGAVVVEGASTTEVQHLGVARGARLDGDTLTVWVRERGRGLYLAPSACPDVAALTGFRATVAGLGPGTYHVRVDAGPASGPPPATAAVTVPGATPGRCRSVSRTPAGVSKTSSGPDLRRVGRSRFRTGSGRLETASGAGVGCA